MLRLGKCQIFVLLVAILVAATVPVPATCEMTAHPDAAPCGTAAADTDTPVESSHCGAGCTDCGLPCCVGTAVILTATPSPAAVTPIPAQPRPECLVRPQVDPAPLGRPPRA